MILGYVQAGVAVWVVVATTLLFVLGAGYSLGEIILLLTGKQPLWKRVALFPLRVAAGKVKRAVEQAVATASHKFVLASPVIARWLHRQAQTVEALSGVIVASNEAALKAFVTLRQTTIPGLIAQATAPLRAQLQRHTDRLNVLEDLNRGVAVLLGNTLRALPWGVPGGYLTNFETFLGRFVQLWSHYWGTTRTQLTTLLGETVPDILRRLEELERGAARGLGQLVQQLRERVEALERWRENVVMPRLNALQAAVDLLSDQVFGPVVGGLTALLERVIALEQAVATLIPAEIARLEDLITELRTDLEEGIRTGLEVFRSRLEALELEVFTELPQRLAAMQLAIDTLAAEIFEEVGAGLTALTTRIVELEQYVFGELREQVELAIGRIEGLEADIRDNILPRLRAIEDLLVPAALAALVLEALRIAAPNLFCNNVTRATRALCADDEAFWEALLAGTLIFAIALNPREVAAAAGALTGALGGVIATTVDN